MSNSRFSDGDVVSVTMNCSAPKIRKGTVGTIIKSYAQSDVHDVEFDPSDLDPGVASIQQMPSDLLQEHAPSPGPGRR